MNREIKVALFLLLCLIGLIAYLEISDSGDDASEQVEQTAQPAITVETKVEEPVEPQTASIPVVETKKEEGQQEATEVEAPKIEEKLEIDVMPQKEVKSEVIEDEIKELPDTYTVQKGDTVSKISEQILGSVVYLPLLLSVNPELRPDQLYVGIELKMPTKSEMGHFIELKNAKLVEPKLEEGQRSYQIQKGDSIYSISKKTYGSYKMVKKILEVNPNLDPKKLRVGSLIILPDQ